jgi:hypothetical protein
LNDQLPMSSQLCTSRPLSPASQLDVALARLAAHHHRETASAAGR